MDLFGFGQMRKTAQDFGTNLSMPFRSSGIARASAICVFLGGVALMGGIDDKTDTTTPMHNGLVGKAVSNDWRTLLIPDFVPDFLRSDWILSPLIFLTGGIVFIIAFRISRSLGR